jgi:hypothetical protein
MKPYITCDDYEIGAFADGCMGEGWGVQGGIMLAFPIKSGLCVSSDGPPDPVPVASPASAPAAAPAPKPENPEPAPISAPLAATRRNRWCCCRLFFCRRCCCPCTECGLLVLVFVLNATRLLVVDCSRTRLLYSYLVSLSLLFSARAARLESFMLSTCSQRNSTASNSFCPPFAYLTLSHLALYKKSY